MSKEEFLKIQTCVLKVNIHCDGCKQKVKNILQKIEGVYTTKIDSEQGKVTVSGNVEPSILIKKLIKNGKHAELWSVAPKINHNVPPNNQLKNQQIVTGKGGANYKGQGGGGGNNQPKGGGGGGGNNQPKGSGGGGNQQLQQIKGLPPQYMKDMKMAMRPVGVGKDPKSVKFNLPEDDGMSDLDDDDEFYGDDDEFDEGDDDELDDVHPPPVNKMMKLPVVGNMPNMLMNWKAAAANGENTKKGGGIVPIQINLGGGEGAKKGGNGNVNQNHGASGGGGKGGGQTKNGSNGNFNPNMAMKGGVMNNGPRGMMPNMMNMGGAGGGGMGQMRNMPMGNMSNPPMGNPQIGQMSSNLAAVQGLPASTMGAGAGGGYFQGAPAPMPGNPYYQQQHANGNERFQPMMYARPPPAVNYMPPYPPYPYPPPPGDRIDQYSMFSDENTSSCTMM